MYYDKDSVEHNVLLHKEMWINLFPDSNKGMLQGTPHSDGV